MNYPTFLKEVDALSSGGGKEQLSAFIHEMARTLPEEKRRWFLDTLSTSVSSSPGKETKRDDSLEKEIRAAIGRLDEIRDGGKAIESEYNEEWDDWNDDPADEFFYRDPDKILPDISNAVSLLEKALDHEEYREGAALAERLSTLSVEVEGDSYYGDAMSLFDLFYNNLIRGDRDETVKTALYLAYMGNESAKRAEAMAGMMFSFGCYSITLESLLSSAPYEMELSSFLPSWIEALASRQDKKVDDLIAEATGMVADPEAVLDYASRYASSHPVIYRDILKKGKEKEYPSGLLSVGLRALDEIPAHQNLRSEVALLTAEHAIKKGEKDIMEKCWLEAFRTTPSVVNYLRLRLLSSSWPGISEGVQRIYRDFYSSSSFFSERVPLAVMLFFDGHFDEVVEKFMNEENGLGWTGTFMKPGIAFFLLLLSDKAAGKGMDTMLSLAMKASSFSAAEFLSGTENKGRKNDAALFAECFERWKKDIHLDEETSAGILEKVEGWVDLRVSAIMGGNKRKYYDECASFIAALGEVVESRGTPGGKEMILEGYRDKYNRRHSFHDSLRMYGMRR